MYFLLVTHLSPLIFCVDRVNIIAEAFWQLEQAHRIHRYGLCNGFNKDLPPRFRSELFFPTGNPLSYSFPKFLKSIHLILSSHHRQTQVFLKLYHTLSIEHIRILSLTSITVFGLKNKFVFCWFIAWLDACSYVPMMWSRQLHSDGMAGKNNRLSSTNNK